MTGDVGIVVFPDRWRLRRRIHNFGIRLMECNYLRTVQSVFDGILVQDTGSFQGIEQLPCLAI